MKPQKSQAARIAEKLGGHLVKFSFLAVGNHNTNYLLETDRRKYVVRIEDNQQFKNLKKEYNFLKRAQPGLGPQVFYFDNSRKILAADYLVEEFIQGQHPSATKVHDDFVVQMSKWFKKLHRNRKPCQQTLQPRREVTPYYRNYLKYRHNLSGTAPREKLVKLIALGLVYLENNQSIFARRRYLSLLHNDPSAGNIFYSPGTVRLIDWEFVGYGLPERELVYFLDSYDLTAAQRKLFLHGYGFPTSKAAQTRLDIAYLILLYSSIGYSLWQLEIQSRNKHASAAAIKALKLRLNRDTRLLEELIVN